MRALDQTPTSAAEAALPLLQSRNASALCPQCQGKSQPCLRTKDYNQQISSEDFQYYLCSDCDLIHLCPIPHDLERYYQDNYGPYTLPNSPTELKLEAEKVRFRIEIIQQFVGKGHLLEIGPSFGAFAFLAKQEGFKVDSIEMDTRCCRFLTDVAGVNCVRTSDVIEALKTAPAYEVITLWHNIEHLVDPWTVLRRISELLLPGGILVISTPNPDALQFKVFGRFWVNLDAPRHLQLIPAPLLIRFMRNCGLTTVLTTTTDVDGLTLNRRGWRESLSHVFTFLHSLRGRGWASEKMRGVKSNRRLKEPRRALSKIISSLPRQLVTNVLNPLEARGWRGAAYTIVFRKVTAGSSVTQERM
jgi:2-polyprenyl-3-methyl-5-hydroxy-6-metoxy-1,4-benzoquinol methylase